MYDNLALKFILVLEIWDMTQNTGRDNKIRTFSHICRLCLCSGFLLHTLTTQSQYHLWFRYLFWKCGAKILSFENQNITHKRYRILLSRPVKMASVVFGGFTLINVKMRCWARTTPLWSGQTDRQKVTHKSPPCNLHRLAQKVKWN